MRRSRRPRVPAEHVLELDRLACIRVEAAAPWQRRVRAAPPAAEPPSAAVAVQHVLVHAAAVGRLKARPAVFCCIAMLAFAFFFFLLTNRS